MKYIEDSVSTVKLINSVFILILLLSLHNIKNIVNCSYEKFLEENMIAKHILIFIGFYFLNEYSELIDITLHPTSKLYRIFVFYIFFIIIMRLNPIGTIIVFSLIFIIHLLSTYKTYYQNEEIKNEEQIETINRNIKYLVYILIVLIIIFFSYNYYTTKNKLGNKINLFKFFLGSVNC